MMTRVLRCCVGILLTCLTASVFYLINMGTDPYQVFAVAVHRQLGISYGQANMLLNTILILFFLFFKRRYINLAMFLSVFVGGFFLDAFNSVLSKFIASDLPIPVKLCLVFAGCINLALGSYLYLASDLGATPADGVGLFISERVGKPYRFIRIFTDIFYALIGVILGGTIGITTVIAVILTGPLIGMIQKFAKRFERRNRQNTGFAL